MLFLGGENYDLLNIRSRTLLKLGFNENALLDADRVVQIKPKWPKVRIFYMAFYRAYHGINNFKLIRVILHVEWFCFLWVNITRHY